MRGLFELEASQMANSKTEEQMAGRVGPDGKLWPDERSWCRSILTLSAKESLKNQ